MQDEISPPSGTQWTIRSGDQEAVVVEVGGGVRAYRVAGREILDGYGEHEVAPGTAGSVLAPWPNRIRDGRYVFAGHSHQLDLSEPEHHNAIHGLVRWAPWRLESASDAAVTLAYGQPAIPGYPWTIRHTTTWELGPDGLRATHTATNASAEPAPFGLGAHPYLAVPGPSVDDVVLTVPARSRLLVDSRRLPIGAAEVAGGDFDFTAPRRIGRTILDTAFGEVNGAGAGSAVTLSTVDGAGSVRVWADEAFHWWQLFTGETLPAPRTRRSVAVEPMTCPPDAFHSGKDLVVLEPGQTWRGSWGITPS